MEGGPTRARRQAALFIVALLLLNAPLLVAVDRLRLPGDVPATPLFLFAAWLLVIALAALNTRRSPRE